MTQAVYGRVGKTYAAPVRALARRVSPMIQARYDAAQDTEQTRKHWRNADSLSAREANSLSVRKKLRERARYEYVNNSYMDGIIQTLVNNMVGAGPRLQVTTPDAELNAAIETKYANWVRASRYVDQLRVKKAAKTVDGEGFGILCVNPLIADPVQLDVRIVECDQFSNGIYRESGQPNNVDGIIFDQWGNPSTYDLLKNHPGDRMGIVQREGERNFDRLPASRVLHWYRAKRPGMVRGIPDVTPALPLFAMLRAFALSTLTSAQTASMFAAVIETEGPVNPADEIKFLDIVNGMMARLPDGTKMHQFQAAHPASTFDMFVKCILREIARCLCIPWHMASGDYSDSNYATARLGSQDFRLAMKVERQDCECEVLDPTFAAWLHESMSIAGYLPPAVQAFRDPYLDEVMAYQRSYRNVVTLPHKWLWPGWDYLDPQTEASADSERLKNGTATLDDICSSQNKDWRQVVRQQAIEEAFRNQVKQELGLGQQPAQPTPDKSATEAAPVQASATIEGCGGEGGTPGPCPQGGSGGGPLATSAAKDKIRREEFAKSEKERWQATPERPDSPEWNQPERKGAEEAAKAAIADGEKALGNDPKKVEVFFYQKTGETSVWVDDVPAGEIAITPKGIRLTNAFDKAKTLPLDASPAEITETVRRLKRYPRPRSAKANAGDADIEACGGKGGKPGPCSSGGGAKSGGGASKGPAGPRPNVDAVAGKVKTLAAGKLSGPHTKALANDMARMTAPELKELKGKLAGSVSPAKAAKAKATATAAVAKAKAAPKPVAPEVTRPTEALSDRAGRDPNMSYEEIQQHVAGLGKRSKTELGAIAKSVQVTPQGKDTKKTLLKKIEESIRSRLGRQQRTRI